MAMIKDKKNLIWLKQVHIQTCLKKIKIFNKLLVNLCKRTDEKNQFNSSSNYNISNNNICPRNNKNSYNNNKMYKINDQQKLSNLF